MQVQVHTKTDRQTATSDIYLYNSMKQKKTASKISAKQQCFEPQFIAEDF